MSYSSYTYRRERILILEYTVTGEHRHGTYFAPPESVLLLGLFKQTGVNGDHEREVHCAQVQDRALRKLLYLANGHRYLTWRTAADSLSVRNEMKV